jgi:hypothetical protein
MSAHRRSIHHNIAYNQRLPCSASGCPRMRSRVGKWCSRHGQQVHTHGVPNAHRLLRREYLQEVEEVSQFLEHHANHVGVRIGIQCLQQWLDGAKAQDRGVPAYEQMARVSISRVSALDILVEVAAVWLYATRNIRALDDGEQLTYALGTAVLHLAPRAVRAVWVQGEQRETPRRIGGPARREVGQHIRDALGPLLFNVATSIDRTTLKGEDTRAALRVPFK